MFWSCSFLAHILALGLSGVLALLFLLYPPPFLYFPSLFSFFVVVVFFFEIGPAVS